MPVVSELHAKICRLLASRTCGLSWWTLCALSLPRTATLGSGLRLFSQVGSLRPGTLVRWTSSFCAGGVSLGRLFWMATRAAAQHLRIGPRAAVQPVAARAFPLQKPI